MISRITFHAAYIFLCIVLFSCKQGQDNTQILKNEESKFSSLSGAYMGQTPPGMEASIFAPEIVCTGHNEVCISFSRDAKEMFYSISGKPHSVILYSREFDGKWTEPEVAPFSGKYGAEFLIAPDGQQILFSTGSPIQEVGAPESMWHLWISEKENTEWSSGTYVESHLNSDGFSIDYPSMAANGSVYFFSLEYPGSLGGGDILRTQSMHGKSAIVNIGEPVNTEYWEMDPFIAQDESYLIFSSNRPGGIGRNDLYISFLKEDGAWSNPINMGERVNSKYQEVHPSVSLDGKYLFFCSNRYTGKNYSDKKLSYQEKLEFLNKPNNGNEDIYWIDAGIIEELKLLAE